MLELYQCWCNWVGICIISLFRDHKESHGLSLADLGEARGRSTNTFVIYSLMISLSDYLSKYLYGSATPSWLKMMLSVIKKTMFNFKGNFKSQRASKSHYWFKSYGGFAECVNFAHWWSISGDGSVSAACAAGLFTFIAQ